MLSHNTMIAGRCAPKEAEVEVFRVKLASCCFMHPYSQSNRLGRMCCLVWCLSSDSQEWKEMMDQVRYGEMKKTTFMNMAWQMYVDAVVKHGEEFQTSAAPKCAGKPKKKQHGGSLINAIRSQMPGLEDADLYAEEIVDTILRFEIIQGRIPVGVCSPVNDPAWATHHDVALEHGRKSGGTGVNWFTGFLGKGS